MSELVFDTAPEVRDELARVIEASVGDSTLDRAKPSRVALRTAAEVAPAGLTDLEFRGVAAGLQRAGLVV